MSNKEDYNQQEIILDSISEGVFTVDKDWRITSFNRAAQEITGIAPSEAIGKYCRDILHADVCQSDCTLQRTMNTGKAVTNNIVHIIDADGNKRAIAISTALLKDKAGNIVGGVETFRDMSTIENLRKEILQKYSCEDIISQSSKIRDIFEVLPNIAKSNITVLIEGPSGSGKELFARAIHNLSSRKDKPFVAINCGALPDTLLESELFGYKAGAFTDAKKDKLGRFDLAQGGTIFLDEIGDISPVMQVKLLRVLQEKTYEPVGAVASVTADVRVIAATNKKLETLVSQGEFREDLYYRINVMRIELPPLKDRKEDIHLLINHFIDKFNRIHNKHITGVTDEAAGTLLAYDYPGNIRELENILEHCFVLCSGDLIQSKDLPVSLRRSSDNDQSCASARGVTIKRMEIELIRSAIERNHGNKTAAAKELGIDKSTLFRKLKSLGL